MAGDGGDNIGDNDDDDIHMYKDIVQTYSQVLGISQRET